MSDLLKWAVGVLFTLILGAYAYANRIDNLVDVRIEKAESRLSKAVEKQEEKLDRLDRKLDRLLERPR